MSNIERIYYMLQENDCDHWFRDNADTLRLAEYLDKMGCIAPPCKVGDTVWDTEGNAWKVFAITIWQDCIGLKTANNRDIRKTFTIGKHSIGKTVFLTREETEQLHRTPQNDEVRE